MHEHGPNCREGPIRGSKAWWRGLAPQPESAEQTVTTTRNNTTKTENKGIRKELVQRIRSEIAAGTYDSPEKWEAALDRLLGRIESA